MSFQLAAIAENLFIEGEYDKSIEILLKLEKENFDLKNIYNLLAQNYLYKFKEAKEKRGFSFMDKFGDAFENRKLLFEKGRDYCIKSIELYNFKDPDGYFTLGELFLIGGDEPSAILNFLRAKNLGDVGALKRLNEISLTPWGKSNIGIVNDILSRLPNSTHKISQNSENTSD